MRERHVREKPGLIQRMKKRVKPDEQYAGPDRWFRMDYMGSSEFEWGALPAALRAMCRHLDELQVRDFTIRAASENAEDGPEVWAVCRENEVGTVLELLAHCLVPPAERGEAWYRRWFLKERPCIYQSLVPDENEPSESFDGWWVIDARVPFVLMRNEEDAERWAQGLRGLKEKKGWW